MTLGERIRQARVNAGLTRLQLAIRLGVSESSVSHWETGRRIPKEANLVRLAEALGVRREDLT